MSDERLERIETKIDRLIDGLADHTKRLDKLEIGQEVLDDKVKQIAEGHAVGLREQEKGFQLIQAALHQRIEPLEAPVRRLNSR